MLPFYEIRKTDLTVKHNTYEVSFPNHMHKYIEIIYVLKGVQHITVEDKAYCVNEGEAAIIFPDIAHSYFKNENETADEILIMCAPKLLGSLFPSLSNFRSSTPIIEKNQIDEETRFALTHINPENNFEVKFGYTCIILSKLINTMILNSDKRIPVQDITYKLTEYINNNFTENITRESLAKTFNLSKYYISRVFAQKFKMNLRSYLGLIRAEHAAVLIRTTNRTLTDICSESGFDSIRTFNRVFKDIYGISPSEFKTNILNYKTKSIK